MAFISGLFAILTLVFFILIILGLIKPSIVKMPSRGKAFLVFFSAMIVSSIIFSATQSDEDKARYAAQNQKSETQAMPADNQQANTQEAVAQPEPEQMVQVTADQLFSAYEQNEIAANQQFKGKKLLVSGKIDSIQADITDSPVIALRAGDQYNFLLPQASLADSEVSKAAQLAKGQQVKLLCTGSSEVAGMAMLSDCYIQ